MAEPGALVLPARPQRGRRWLVPDGQGATTLALLAAIALIWTASRPYGGLLHDSRLYTLQAMALGNAGLNQDLFLAFGSQDSFTVFSRLYAPVLSWLGIPVAAAVLTIVAQAAWLSGAFLLATAFFRDRRVAFLAMAALVAFPSAYGSGFFFSFGESHLTPRLFAEALVMAALGLHMQRRAAASCLAIIAAGVLHPLMALPGAALLFLCHTFSDRRWWLVALAVASTSGALAALGVEPLARLRTQMDPEWFETVHRASFYTFIGNWGVLDWCYVASPVLLAVQVLVLKLLEPSRRTTLMAVLAVAGAGLLTTYVGADLARNQLVINLQLWRGLWILGVLSNFLATPLLLWICDRKSKAHNLTRLLIGVGLVSWFCAALLSVMYLWATLVLATGVAASVIFRPSEKPTLRSAVASVLLVASTLAVASLAMWHHFTILVPLPDTLQNGITNITLKGIGLVSVILLTMVRKPSPAKQAAPWTAFTGLVMLLLAAFAARDQRTAWAKYVEAPGPPAQSLLEFLPKNTAVYWDGGHELLWFRLLRPSYYSCTQGAGTMFYRETATTYQHRNESFRFEQPLFKQCLSGTDVAPVPATAAELQRACAREVRLDYIVLPQDVSGLYSARWTAPVALEYVSGLEGKLSVLRAKDFYRYDCAHLRPPS